MGSSSLALMRELQYALYEIARRAELGSSQSLTGVQQRAEQSLRLIDSYIATTQIEIGQTQLNLSPIGVGSILHEAAYSLRSETGCIVSVVTGVNHPVMTHAELLKNLLSNTGQFILDTVKTQLVFRSFPVKDGTVGVGVFAKNFNVTSSDLKNAIEISGTSHMPMAQHSYRSGIMLVMADALAQGLGSSLTIKRMGIFQGIAVTLPKSQQLSFATE